MEKYKISIGQKELNREEIVDFLSRIFGPNYYDALLVQGAILDAEPSTSPRNFILARSAEGELIGVVRIVERNILLDGAVLATGCISSVGVKPEWRVQGVASRMMNIAIEAMTSRGMDISVLYSRRAVDGFYPRFGFYGIGRYFDLEIISTPHSDIYINTIPFMRENLEMCLELYNKIYSGLTGSVLRDLHIWEFLCMRVEKKIGGFKVFICLENQEIIGYLVMFENKLIEISIPSRIFPAIPGLLSKLNIQSISLHPRHPFYIYCRTRMNTIQKERSALDGGYMARILNSESLLKKLGPTLVSRAATIARSDKTVRLLNCEVDLESGKISKTSKPNDIIFEKMQTAVQFVLGVIPPQDIIGVSWTEKKPWIPYLFPELYLHTSAWDEV